MSILTAYKPLTRIEMAARVARDIPEGWYVNLGIGAPLQIADHVPSFGDEAVWLMKALGFAGLWSSLCGLLYFAVEPYVRRRWPWRLISWNQDLANFVLDALHTLLRWARAQIPPAISRKAVRSKRIPKKVEPLVPSVPDRGLCLVQRQRAELPQAGPA